MKIQKNFYYMKLLATLFLSLFSYYFYQLHMAPIPLLGLFILFSIFLLQRKKTFLLTDIIFPLTIIFLSILSMCGALFQDYTYLPQLIVTNMGFISMGITLLLVKTVINKDEMKKIVIFLLFFHLIFFYVQFFSWHLWHVYPDFLKPVTGESQRHFYAAIYVRCTGLFNEPATYSLVISCLLLLLLPVMQTKRETMLFFSALVSLFFSLSTTAECFAVFILMNYLILNHRNQDKMIWIIIAIIALLGSYYAYEHWAGINTMLGLQHKTDINTKFDGRLAPLITPWDTPSMINWLFGPIFVAPGTPIGTNLMLIVLQYGLIGATLFIITILSQMKGVVHLSLIIVALAGVGAIQFPLFGFLLACCSGMISQPVKIYNTRIVKQCTA